MEEPNFLHGREQGPYKKIASDGISRKFKEVYSDDRTLIKREIRTGAVAETLKVPDEPVEIAKKVNEVFKELREKYHIPVAVHLVVADDSTSTAKEEIPTLHLLVDKIKGRSLLGIGTDLNRAMSAAEQEGFKEEISHLICSLAVYGLEKSDNTLFLWDVAGANQFVWGKKMEGEVPEDKPHIYLIDADPYFPGHFDRAYGRDLGKHNIEIYFGHLANLFYRFEGALDEDQRARAVVELDKLVDAGKMVKVPDGGYMAK